MVLGKRAWIWEINFSAPFFGFPQNHSDLRQNHPKIAQIHPQIHPKPNQKMVKTIGDVLDWRFCGDLLEIYWRFSGDLVEI